MPFFCRTAVGLWKKQCLNTKEVLRSRLLVNLHLKRKLIVLPATWKQSRQPVPSFLGEPWNPGRSCQRWKHLWCRVATLQCLAPRSLSTSHILIKIRGYCFSTKGIKVLLLQENALYWLDCCKTVLKICLNISLFVHSNLSQHRASLTSSCKFRAYGDLKTKPNKYWSITVYQSWSEEISNW